MRNRALRRRGPMRQLARNQVAGNPWLARMFLAGVASVLVGLAIVLVVQADKTCSDEGVCVPAGFTGTQVVGLGLMLVGLLAVGGWLATSAVCWQLDRLSDRPSDRQSDRQAQSDWPLDRQLDRRRAE